MNESKLVNGVDVPNGLDETGAFPSPERTLLPPPPVNSPATSIPGWFNMSTTSSAATGTGDGWPARSEENNSGSVPMQNGTKRLKTQHIPIAKTPAPSEDGDASAAAEDNPESSGEGSNDSQSLSEPSDGSSKSSLLP